ncbi:MAG TPA: hypothetical protein VHF23_08935 [Gaiellaceae bacterium]|nr:hypothetical protein [Gaiellaceae bacterium]
MGRARQDGLAAGETRDDQFAAAGAGAPVGDPVVRDPHRCVAERVADGVRRRVGRREPRERAPVAGGGQVAGERPVVLERVDDPALGLHQAARRVQLPPVARVHDDDVSAIHLLPLDRQVGVGERQVAVGGHGRLGWGLR